MSQDDAPIWIYTTFEGTEAAKRVGRALVKSRLAACVNIIPGITAIYEWEGALEEAGECAMLIKTRHGLKERVLEEARRLHSYDTPALLVIRIDDGHFEFLAWMVEQTQPV